MLSFTKSVIKNRDKEFKRIDKEKKKAIKIVTQKIQNMAYDNKTKKALLRQQIDKINALAGQEKVKACDRAASFMNGNFAMPTYTPVASSNVPKQKSTIHAQQQNKKHMGQQCCSCIYCDFPDKVKIGNTKDAYLRFCSAKHIYIHPSDNACPNFRCF